MKNEDITLIVSMIINFIISLLKIGGGILGSCNSLMADGLHTASDFITDIIAMIGNKISKKRANRFHPFGYGRSEYIAGIFMGIIILLLGIFILVRAFLGKSEVMPIWLIPLILITIILKLISIYFLKNTGRKIKSNLLLSSAKESMTDLYSSVVVIVIILLSRVPYLEKIDIIGTVGLALFILITSYKILKENIISLVGVIEDNDELISQITKVLSKVKKIEIDEIELLKYGFYYHANLKIKVKPDMSVIQLINLENKITKLIKKKKFGIKYVNIEICIK